MPDWLVKKFLSRKFWVAMLAAVWWLVEGSLNGTMAAVGWKVVAVVLGYVAAEGTKDALLAYWQGPDKK